ncbi:MAG TPA: alpha/beta hydrolase [Roseiflexaceae bacterium]|nr:alpha/beta hydrolase [Roseiflexaceae bacterium]
MSVSTVIDRYAGVTPQRGEVQAGPTRLSYLDWGNPDDHVERTVVLLHGITSSARTWWRAAPALARQGYHVYAFDMPGHGQSDETSDHRIDHLAELAAEAMRALNLKDVTLIGHSWGGATALALASSDAGRELLRRVVLIDPAVRMNPQRGNAILANYLVGVGDPPEQTLPTLRANNPDWHEYDLFWKGEAFQQCRAGAVRGLFVGSGDWDFTERFAQVGIPLLLLVADPQYTAIAPDALEIVERNLRPELGKMLVLPGTTHNMMRGDGFDPTMEALSAWLSDHYSKEQNT